MKDKKMNVYQGKNTYRVSKDKLKKSGFLSSLVEDTGSKEVYLPSSIASITLFLDDVVGGGEDEFIEQIKLADYLDAEEYFNLIVKSPSFLVYTYILDSFHDGIIERIALLIHLHRLPEEMNTLRTKRGERLINLWIKKYMLDKDVFTVDGHTYRKKSKQDTGEILELSFTIKDVPNYDHYNFYKNSEGRYVFPIRDIRVELSWYLNGAKHTELRSDSIIFWDMDGNVEYEGIILPITNM